MEPNEGADIGKRGLKQDELDNILENIKSHYILKVILSNLQNCKSLQIVRYNKKMQNKLNITINDYIEEYSRIEIEIIPNKTRNIGYINIPEENYDIIEEDNVIKIKMKIDSKKKTFKKLFYGCDWIETITFKKFYRNNITDMSYMFCECSSLKEIKFSKFNSSNVTNMSFMFFGCSSLDELNLSKFNTNKVTDMGHMFSGCTSLKKLNIYNFNTDKVINMNSMFAYCSSLNEFIISDFNMKKVIYSSYMYHECSEIVKKTISAKNKCIIL